MLKKIKQIVSRGNSSKTFSYSQLNTFKTCPQQYKIIYMDGLRKEHESIEAFMGKRVHGVMEWLYSKENREKPYITFDRLCQTYDEQWLAPGIRKSTLLIPAIIQISIMQLARDVCQITMAATDPPLIKWWKIRRLN